MVSIPGAACFQEKAIQHICDLGYTSAAVELSKIHQLVAAGTKKRVDDASKMGRATHIEHSRVTSPSNERFDVFLEVIILLLGLTNVSELHNHLPANTFVAIERLYSQHSCPTLARC